MTGPAARRRRADAAGVALLAALAAAMALRVGDHAIDDFFITYRYAENLASGHGLVFDPGERVFGTTAPGLALLLAALRVLTRLPVPVLGTVTTFAAIVATAAIVFVQGRRRGRGPEALAGGALVATSTYAWVHNGADVFVVLALLAAAATLAARRTATADATAGLVAGYAAWCRPDAVLGIGVLGLLEWVRRRRLPRAYGFAAAATLAAGLLAAEAWFGRFLPATLEAKRLQAAWLPWVWPSGADFWPAAVRLLVDHAAGAALAPLVVVGLAGLPVAIRRGGPALRLLVLYAILQAASYPLLGVALYAWYLLPALVALAYGTAFAAGAAGRSTRRFFGARAGAAVPGALVAALLVAPVGLETGRRVWRMINAPYVEARLEDYRRAGLWLRRHTAPDQVVATVEVGSLGFYSRRPIHDVMGLVSPEALPHIARGDQAGALASGAPDVFLIYAPHEPFLGAVTDTERFAAGWCELARLPGHEELVVYGRRVAGDGAPAGRPGCAASPEESLRRGSARTRSRSQTQTLGSPRSGAPHAASK